MDCHEERVRKLSSEVRGFYDRKETFRIYHGSTNSTRRGKWKRSQVVDTSGLNHVLQVDPEKHMAIVEPNVPMDKLAEATLQYGLIPPVVPEFPGITVGGAVVGQSGESSSFKYEFLHSNIEEVEMILANGEVTNASATRNFDLFDSVPSSFGTLGVLTLVKMHLVSAKRFVALTYHSVTSFSDVISKTANFTTDPTIDFIDSIVFKRNKAVIMTGNFVDDPLTQPIRHFSRAHDQWFYINARRKFSQAGKPVSEIIPLKDYLFRYDRGGFWTGRYAFKYFCVPFDRFSRWLTNWFMRTRVLYQALHESGMGEFYIIQDVALSHEQAENFLDFVFQDLKIHPLWVCPLKKRPTGVMSPRSDSSPSREDKESDRTSESAEKQVSELMFNVGIWGPGPRDREKLHALNRRLEKKVQDLGGIKWLYAQTFYTEEEFWNLYDRDAYDALRAKYHASGLPTVYDKVKLHSDVHEEAGSLGTRVRNRAKEIWPIRGVYGVWCSVTKTDYLLDRKKA